MSKSRILALAWPVVLTLAACSHQSVLPSPEPQGNIAGLWEITVTIQTDPANKWISSPAVHFSQCLKDGRLPDQMAQIYRPGTSPHCRTTRSGRHHNTLYWTRVCYENGTEIIYNGQNTFNEDTMSGWQDISRNHHTTRNLYQGKRVRSSCP